MFGRVPDDLGYIYERTDQPQEYKSDGKSTGRITVLLMAVDLDWEQ